MNRLSSDPEQRCGVDWLTEVVRRLSEAASDGSMQSVKITPTRLEKVGHIISDAKQSLQKYAAVERP